MNHRNFRSFNQRKIIPLMSVCIGVMIFFRPDIVMYLLAFYLIITGILGLME
ncbi:MAG: DUF3096 domain-containing protein [Planctomycetes bacterium]|jgi:hypothetical protein|nr:DUF3096 domain-containing protein [Planctomycetota bacterium]